MSPVITFVPWRFANEASRFGRTPWKFGKRSLKYITGSWENCVGRIDWFTAIEPLYPNVDTPPPNTVTGGVLLVL